MDNFEACPGDCYERHPTAAGCNFSTWASNRDLWQWILKSRFLSFVILKVSRGKVEILSKEIIRIRCFQINKENWWWWIHFSRSLTLAALKGALVTLCRPLSAGLRISFQLKVNSHIKEWALLQKIREARLKVVHVSVQHFWTFTSRFSPWKGVYGHITLNTPVLVRSLKLSKVETC